MCLIFGVFVIGDDHFELVLEERQYILSFRQWVRPIAYLLTNLPHDSRIIFIISRVKGLKNNEFAHSLKKVHKG